MFGAFPFGAGYFGQASMGGAIIIVIPPLGPVDLVQLRASIRTAVDVMGTMRSRVNATGTVRTSIDLQGER